MTTNKISANELTGQGQSWNSKHFNFVTLQIKEVSLKSIIHERAKRKVNLVKITLIKQFNLSEFQ